MGWVKSTPFLAAFTSVVLLSSCTGVSDRGHEPLIFALNLSDKPVTLSLVKNDAPLVSFGSLNPMESLPLTKVHTVEGAFLKLGDGDSAEDWKDPSGTPYSLQLKSGALYAIVVDRSGQAALYSLPETYSSDPKVCVVNTTALPLSQIQVAPDWAKNVKIYAQDVTPIVPSEFFSIESKTLGLYWQTLAQVASGAHTTAVDAEGHPLRPTFLSRRYYLFLAGEGSLRDITPQLE